jgi:hypothetical protein
MKLIFTFLLCSITCFTFAQSSLPKTISLAGTEWYEGIVVLDNGQILRGIIKYNARNEVLSYESGQFSKSFAPKHVTAFQFTDDATGCQRVFYSIPFEDSRNNIERKIFFEHILDAGDFMVLSKVSPLRLEKKEYNPPAFIPIAGSITGGKYYGYPTAFNSSETLFFMTKQGMITPYLETSEREIDGVFFDRTRKRNKILNRDILKHLTKPYYTQLISFAKKENLLLNSKDDVIRILNHYKKLQEKD